MMGTKVRRFEPLQQISLDDLVPHDHFYRHVAHTLDLAFVRDLVAMPRIDRRFALISGVARAELVLWCRGYELWECLIVGWVGVRRRVPS